jgi:hypothetical protein
MCVCVRARVRARARANKVNDGFDFSNLSNHMEITILLPTVVNYRSVLSADS